MSQTKPLFLLHLYDGIGRLTTLDHKKGTTSLARYDYTFDADSRITSVNSLVDGVTNFSYDVTDQLTGADHASQPDENYSFDLNGNRTMAGYAVQTNNRLTSDGTYNYEYDHEGNRTARVKISTGERTEYEWDYRNRLTKITEKNSSGQVTRTTEQSYDAFNRWVRRRVDMDGPGPGAPTDTFFAHEGEQIVLQFNGGQASNLDHRYLWGPAVDQLLADQDAVSLTSAGTNLWPLGDHLGTLRDLASYDSSTNTTTVTNHRRYDSFGNLISETNAAVDELFGFTGRALDEFTGLQNNWSRWYDAKVGQWLSEDPIGFQGGDANLSRYVENSPIILVDPLGLASDPMGHHIINKGNWWWMPPVVKDYFNSKEARIANEYYTSHNSSTINGVSHREYNEEIRKELDKFLKERGKTKSCMTKKDAQDFLQRILNTDNEKINHFLVGIRAEADLARRVGIEKFNEELRKLKPGTKIDKAKKAAIKAAKRAVKQWRKAMAKQIAKSAGKRLSQRAVRGVTREILEKYIPMAAVAACALNGDMDAVAREMFLEMTPLGLARDGGLIVGEFYDEVVREGEETAEANRTDPHGVLNFHNGHPRY